MSNSAFEERFDKDWIKRVNEWAAPIADEMNKKESERTKGQKKAYSKTKAFKDSYKKYIKSEKGQAAVRKKSAVYARRIRNLSKMLDIQEKKAIIQFYINCPEGHHVDHIIPISKGGTHKLNNLQYLSATENCKKGNRMCPERDKISYDFLKFRQNNICRHCENQMIFLSDETVFCESCRKAFAIVYFEDLSDVDIPLPTSATRS